MRNVLTKRLTIRGFIVTDFAAKFPDFIRDVPQWIRQGHIKYREDIAEGLENAPQAFMGLLKGKNFGKQLVRVAE
jgi:NADPH-dependent curcumin reductase CurA